jgi:DNA-binding transcriptional MerR regulator
LDYSIGEFSKVTGLGIHTLRYYEHEGLIIPLRNSSNRRRYSEKDIAWIAFIKRLKATGMPIKEIKKYAALRTKGDATLSERMKMLVQHRQSLNKQIRQLQEHEAILDEKIAFYRQEIERHRSDTP